MALQTVKAVKSGGFSAQADHAPRVNVAHWEGGNAFVEVVGNEAWVSVQMDKAGLQALMAAIEDIMGLMPDPKPELTDIDAVQQVMKTTFPYSHPNGVSAHDASNLLRNFNELGFVVERAGNVKP
jgi:hypothetical protein